MESMYKGFLSCGTIEKPALDCHDFLGVKIHGRIPVVLLQIDGMDRRIGNMQKIFTVRGNSQGHMARYVSRCRDGVDAG